MSNLEVSRKGPCMAKKKQMHSPVSPEDTARAQQIFEHYQQLTLAVRSSQDRQQVETALAEINTAAEGAQMTLLALLGKTQTIEAADLLVALYKCAERKEVRKEARRALIRLEGAKIYPHWEAPLEPTPDLLASPLSTNPPRFWKGFVTAVGEDSNEIEVGETEILLCWQQGEDYKEVRVLGFLLEFWHDGVKDFFTRTESQRGFENFMARLNMRPSGIKLKDCSLARGRKLLRTALEVNALHGTRPARDYQLNSALVHQLILEAPELEDEEDDEEEEIEFDTGDALDEEEREIDLSGLDPTNVVATFVENWIDGDYGIAYKLLAHESPLREDLSAEDWVEKRETWAQTFYPEDFEPGMLHERERSQSKLWLPNPFNQSSTTREVEASWSFEMVQTPLEDKLPELPEATVIYKETGRHWYWASFTLTQDNGEWRIQSLSDEFVRAQGLSVKELQQRIDTLTGEIEKIAQEHTPDELKSQADDALATYLNEIVTHLLQTLSYIDALIPKTPRDRSLYERASAMTMMFGMHERCLAYLGPLAEQSTGDHERAQTYLGMAELQMTQSQHCLEDDDEDRADLYEELAEEALRKSLASEDSFDAHTSLARLFIEQSERPAETSELPNEDEGRLDEAEEQLRLAKPLAASPENEAEVEYYQGRLAMARAQFQQALSHYQHVVDFDPEDPSAWIDLGDAHKRLEHFEEAETSYKRAIELDPSQADYYSSLSLLYTDQDQFPKAMQTLENGLAANPESLALHMYIVVAYMSHGDYDEAEVFLQKIERLAPDNETLAELRQTLTLLKVMQDPSGHEPSRFTGPKKKKKR